MRLILKKAFIFLVLLLGCQTPSRVLDVGTTQFSYESYEGQPFGAPAFYSKWKKKPVAIYVASENGDLYNATEHAVAEMNQAIGFDLLILKGIQRIENQEEEYKGRNSINAIMKVPDDVYMKIAERHPKSLAITKLITSKNQLYEADIMIRSSTVKSRFLKATILHELGHALGLGHTQDQRSFMYPELRDPKRYTLGKEDRRDLHSRYSEALPLAARKTPPAVVEQGFAPQAH
jgi:hypothetical protein